MSDLVNCNRVRCSFTFWEIWPLFIVQLYRNGSFFTTQMSLIWLKSSRSVILHLYVANIDKKHGNDTKPGFHATSALWYILKLRSNILKLLSLASECIMIYLLKILNGHHFESYNPIDTKISPHLCLDMTYPSEKFDVDLLTLTLPSPSTGVSGSLTVTVA